MQTITAPPAIGHFLNAVEIRQFIADGQRFIASRQLETAAVLFWAAFEAAVRLSLTDLGQRTENPISVSDTPLGLTAQAVAYGVIDPEDREVLLRFLPVRDAAKSGEAAAIDTSLLQEVSRFAKRTLDEMTQP